MNAQTVRLESVNPEIEEEITLSSGEARLICFSTRLPREVYVGSEYPVVLTLQVFGEYAVEEIEPGAEDELVKLQAGYSYLIKGVLKNGCLFSRGFIFQDEALQSEFGFLDGKNISIIVDRVGAKFIDR